MKPFKEPLPVKRFTAVIFSDYASMVRAKQKLEKAFGKIDGESETFNFSNFSSYYEKEMGPSLTKFFVTFEKLVDPSLLAEDKLTTATIELELKDSRGGRRVNIDPGHLSAANLVLATSKNFVHRIYLRDGVYAEVTLRFIKKRFEPLPWTYRDYRTDASLEFFKKARNLNGEYPDML